MKKTEKVTDKFVFKTFFYETLGPVSKINIKRTKLAVKREQKKGSASAWRTI